MGANKSKTVYDEVWILDTERETLCLASLIQTIESIRESSKEKKIFLACSYEVERIQTVINQYNLEVVKVDQNVQYFDTLLSLSRLSQEAKLHYYININNEDSSYTSIGNNDNEMKIKDMGSTILIINSGDVIVCPNFTLHSVEVCRMGVYIVDDKQGYYSLSGTVIRTRLLTLLLKQFLDTKQQIVDNCDIEQYLIGISTKKLSNYIVKTFNTVRQFTKERKLQKRQILEDYIIFR